MQSTVEALPALASTAFAVFTVCAVAAPPWLCVRGGAPVRSWRTGYAIGLSALAMLLAAGLLAPASDGLREDGTHELLANATTMSTVLLFVMLWSVFGPGEARTFLRPGWRRVAILPLALTFMLGLQPLAVAITSTPSTVPDEYVMPTLREDFADMEADGERADRCSARQHASRKPTVEVSWGASLPGEQRLGFEREYVLPTGEGSGFEESLPAWQIFMLQHGWLALAVVLQAMLAFIGLLIPSDVATAKTPTNA